MMNSLNRGYPPLKLYNSMSDKIEQFSPRADKKVKIFTCGPSVYQHAHIGNFRTFLFEDLLIRYLEYHGYKVERVLNFTDVEDKAVDQAKADGIEMKELTENVANRFLKESKLLRLKPPTYNPRSSTSIDQAVFLIKQLLDKEIAYWHKGNVYFDPLKFEGFGKLYGLDMRLWPKKKKRFKKDTYPGSRWNLGDFILWHGCTNGEKVCWDEALGSGRPSWNVQDPAMATKYLGFKIDICCGGIDNLIRHHDYNIAVVEGVSGEEFASFWLHGAHLFAYGKKMSKSIGNVIYVDDLLKDGYSPEHIRFYLIYTPYRNKLNFTKKHFQETSEKLDKFRKLVDKLLDQKSCITRVKTEPTIGKMIEEMLPKFEECMNNDLDLKCAFDDLFEDVAKLISYKENGKLSINDCKMLSKNLHKIDDVLQIIF